MQAPVAVPYAIIADAFRNGTVVPFLGAAASFAGADPTSALPSGRKLAEIISQGGIYPGPTTDPLSKIAEYIQEVPSDRPSLVLKMLSIFGSEVKQDYRCCITDFLSRLPQQYMPRLIVTTNYDLLVERTLEQRRIPYFAISHIVRTSKDAAKFLCYESLQQDLKDCILVRTALDDRFLELDDENRNVVFVYKIHGTAWGRLSPQQVIDSLVLTESDYIEFLEEERLNRIPVRVLRLLRQANLLFLGYSLQDWNLRVLLQRLQRIQQKQKQGIRKHWACRLTESADEVEEKFWGVRGVNTYSLPLETFLSEILEDLRRGG